MRFEPDIDRERLRDTVSAAYDLDVRTLEFTPVGLGSACYVVSTREADYFLKLWTHLRRDQPAARRQRATVELTRALHERDVGVRVPYPLALRDGAPWGEFEGMPLALAPLLPGIMPEVWSPALYAELGRTVAAFHLATPALADVLPAAAPIEVYFEAALRRDLDAAARIEVDARPALRSTRAWVLERRADVEAQLARLLELQVEVRRLEGPLVLCHVDLHAANLLVGDDGRFSVLDWDDAALAPAEWDLWAGLGEMGYTRDGFPAFLDAYRIAIGTPPPLRLERFAYYLLRRFLEDTWLSLRDLLAPDADPREDQVLLRSLEAGCRFGSRLDSVLEVIATELEG